MKTHLLRICFNTVTSDSFCVVFSTIGDLWVINKKKEKKKNLKYLFIPILIWRVCVAGKEHFTNDGDGTLMTVMSGKSQEFHF